MTKDVYIALDFPEGAAAENFLKQNQLEGVPVKVGMELFYREGPIIIEKLKDRGHPVFLDLKLHDIPTTVMKAMSNLAKLQVDMVNVHALGGGEMIHYAKEGLLAGSSTGKGPKLIAVTVLTSMEEATIQEDLKLSGSLVDNTVHLAELSHEHGADGVVCSVHEASQIKEACSADFLTVTPGIRLDGTDSNDQKRVASPRYAKENNADIIVIGRSVTKADDPRAAYERAVKEWQV
ncbi:orotidine-5'-phosphate decarboxylase [Virgibacillus xinjiangensis]|uniref:Orotidine 5'-phosphate decarboxylase n=1 Tax=Virgibacillus xinjiangensis TaxID=393090 RepID=A0ABV7CVT1_9BACI